MGSISKGNNVEILHHASGSQEIFKTGR